MSLESLLARWHSDPEMAANFSAWVTHPARPPDLRPLPPDLPEALATLLKGEGISALFSHQAETWEHAAARENVVLATGTASGKTLAYHLPVLSRLLAEPQARALYLFPTKALAQDQFAGLAAFAPAFGELRAAIYDGDTQASHRKAIRHNVRLLFTNPDMLHAGILPHHTNWADLFSNLDFVIIDEMHTYRGVFGSHVANVIRRLKRVAKFYGSAPQFILASATIGNPAELAEKLIEAPVHLVKTDGSGRGARHFMIYNPPVIDESIGLRKSSMLESVRLSQQLHAEGLQHVLFTRSRRSVEILLTYLQAEQTVQPGTEQAPQPPASEIIRGYRSGYLPSQRREIEKGLRDGSIRAVVSTNALELGIDIGGLGAAILVGYPGNIASARQQAGRAGRGREAAAAVLVATANPIDQFLAHHPEYFFDRSPEQALIAPDHLLILLNHLRCAMFELPFEQGENFGGHAVEEFMDFLMANQEAHFSNQRYYWMAAEYPAADLSLRSASPESYILQVEGEQARTIGLVDGASAFWMVHPGAVYMHEARQYFVEDLDLTRKIARLKNFDGDYFTEPLRQTTIQVLAVNDQQVLLNPANGVVTHSKGWGEVQATMQVTGFRKVRWYSRENLGEEALDLPTSELQTTGYWLSIAEETVQSLSRDGLWTNAPNDYGPGWNGLREAVRARDNFTCQVCGRAEAGRQHDVHHKVPFRMQRDEKGRVRRDKANELSNLVTLCPECHQKAETNVRMRSGLAGLAYVLANLAPLFLMCDHGDLLTHVEGMPTGSFPLPTVVLYDQVPAGIGFSEKLFSLHGELVARALELVQECACEDGCPSCVGPGGENGLGGKPETLAILRELAR